MELEQFKGLALRTESTIEGVKLDRIVLSDLLELTVRLTEVLDGVKKAVFYNKTVKLEETFLKHLTVIENVARGLRVRDDAFKTINTTALNGHSIFSSRTIQNLDPRVFHGILGIITESGELAAAMRKVVDNTFETIDAVNIQEEMSDIAWYKAILHDELKLDWGQGLANVIEKLRIRYPDKYTDYNADNRDLAAERAALEVGTQTQQAPGYALARSAEAFEVVTDGIGGFSVIPRPAANIHTVPRPAQPVGADYDAFINEENLEPAARRVFYIEVPNGMTKEQAQAIIERFSDCY